MNSKTGSSTTCDEKAANHSMSYIRDFNQQAEKSKYSLTDEALVLLNRSIGLISSTVQLQYLTPNCLDTKKFYSNLHDVLMNVSTENDIMWNSAAFLLQACSRNTSIRKAVISDFKFVPLIADILKNTQSQDKVLRALLLLQELTYGIKISWAEPYLDGLIETLLEIVEIGEEKSGQLALSILINICFKNFAVQFLLLRAVNLSDFSKKISSYGFLANKLVIIMAENTHSPDRKELHRFINASFAAIGECIKSWNVSYMRHIIEFLLDSKSHKGLHSAVRSYEHYCDDVGRLLDLIDSHIITNDSNEKYTSQQSCLSLIFQLFNEISKLSNCLNDDGTESQISLKANLMRIFELICNWIASDEAGIDAVKLLDTFLRQPEGEELTSRISRDPSIVVHLIDISEKWETDRNHTTSILQLILILLHKKKTEKLILSKITESYFDKIFAPLLSTELEHLICNSSVGKDDIEKYVICLLLLINFAEIAKKAYFDKCCTLLQSAHFQVALARAMVCGNEAACLAVFQISLFEHFPKHEVAKYISQLCGNIEKPSASHDPLTNMRTISSSQGLVSIKTEERVNALIDSINEALRNNHINNVPVSQLMELYNHKITIAKESESNTSKRLQNAIDEITSSARCISLKEAEVEKHREMNFRLQLNLERYQHQCSDLTKQKENLKTNVTNLMKKLEEKSKSIDLNEKRLQMKSSEMIALKNECEDLNNKLKAKIEELDRLHAANRDNLSRIEKLKISVSAFEANAKEKAQLLKEREQQLLKAMESLDEEREEIRKSKNLIQSLETQLRDKNEQIKNYESELLETEELRKTILSLMESKRPKRTK